MPLLSNALNAPSWRCRRTNVTGNETAAPVGNLAGTGAATFIDPLGGQATQVNITGLSLGNLNTNYSGGASIRAVYIEAPVPECSTLLMLAMGLGLMSLCVKMDFCVRKH